MGDKVFVVSRGERYGESRIVSIHKHVKDAVKVATEANCDFGGGWVTIRERKLGPKLRFYAENSCDFIKVECWEVG